MLRMLEEHPGFGGLQPHPAAHELWIASTSGDAFPAAFLAWFPSTDDRVDAMLRVNVGSWGAPATAEEILALVEEDLDSEGSVATDYPGFRATGLEASVADRVELPFGPAVRARWVAVIEPAPGQPGRSADRPSDPRRIEATWCAVIGVPDPVLGAGDILFITAYVDEADREVAASIESMLESLEPVVAPR